MFYSHIQRLKYLDEADMLDEKQLAFYHIVSGGTVKLEVWPEWKTLIRAASKGDYYGTYILYVWMHVCDSPFEFACIHVYLYFMEGLGVGWWETLHVTGKRKSSNNMFATRGCTK